MEDDGSLDYMSGLSTSSSGGLNAQGGPGTPASTPAAVSGASSLVSSGGGGGGGGGSGIATTDYYSYDYDSRTYRLPSTLVGRNYFYPPSSVPLNQVSIMQREGENVSVEENFAVKTLLETMEPLGSKVTLCTARYLLS